MPDLDNMAGPIKPHPDVDKIHLGDPGQPWPHQSSEYENTGFYSRKGPYTLTVSDHIPEYVNNDPTTWFDPNDPSKRYGRYKSDVKRDGPSKYKYEYLKNTSEHFTYDPNDTKAMNYPKIMTDNEGNEYVPFSGSSTIINAEGDPDKDYIINYGLDASESDKARQNNGDYAKPPISPFQPFTQMDPATAHRSAFVAYNRTHIPVADLEFRKGFRHIFITRPECYIMCAEGGLSEQCEYNDDFVSAYNRFPYILELLSPSYLPNRINVGLDGLTTNWNYLLTNRVTGMNLNTMEMSTMSNTMKTTVGQQITYPTIISSEMNGQLQLNFNETKQFEISEMIRLWMLYMNNRHRGIFAPPFNGYRKHNDFNLANIGLEGDSGMAGNAGVKLSSTILHPYDRASEYPCTIFDIITNESDTKVLYYCAYLGCYPSQLSRPFNTQNGGGLAQNIQVSVNFQYQAKIENNERALIHFNYNAGLVDAVGNATKQVAESIPFLLNSGELRTNKLLKNYIGAAGMFTGSPYIIMGSGGVSSVGQKRAISVPFLKFAPILEGEFNDIANLGIVNHSDQADGNIISLQEQQEETDSGGIVDVIVSSAGDAVRDNLRSAIVDGISNVKDTVVSAVVDTGLNVIERITGIDIT